MHIEWKTPPDSTAPVAQSPIEPFVDELKRHPGEWALYGHKGASMAAYLRKRYGLEAVTRNNKNGKADIYARWKEPT